MDFTKVPIHLDWTQRFILERGPQECCCLLPEHEFCSASLLVDALAQAFSMTEDDMCKGVHELLYELHTDVARVVDMWLLDAGVLCKQYLSCVVNHGSAVDGLFVWLAANLMK